MSDRPIADAPGGGTAAAWGRVPLVLRVLALVVAAVLIGEYLSVFFGSVLGSRTVPSAPTSPASVGPSGTAAFVRLLERVHRDVVVDGDALDARSVPRGATLMFLDPRHVSGEDLAVVRATVAGGGRVVFVGAAPAGLGALLAPGGEVTRRATPAGPVVATAPTRLAYGVRALSTGVGTLSTSGPVRVDVRGSNGPFVASSGALAWVGSSSPFRRANLATLDNAALAWNLSGPPSRAVVIATADMALPAQATGLRALPAWWLAGLAVIALAGAAWLASAARRFGPLERRARALAPPRVGHAEAMGALLAAMPAKSVPAATEPVAVGAHDLLVRRLRLDGRADAAVLHEAALASGVPAWVERGATTPVATRDDAIEAGRALAWLAAERGAR